MIRIILFILLGTMTVSAFAQNATLRIGRGTDCFGRGACSISTENNRSYNSTLYKSLNGDNILRIHRDRLSESEEDRLLGAPITLQNRDRLEFVMQEPIQLPPTVSVLMDPDNQNSVTNLPAGTYSTRISDEYIDIILPNSND